MSAAIAIAGCKNSGKSSLCKYIYHLVARIEGLIVDDPYSGEFTNKLLIQMINPEGVGMYVSSGDSTYKRVKISGEPSVEMTSFASPVKKICTDILGLETCQVYGSDEEKNTLTKYEWENMPSHIKDGYGTDKSGKITAREVMQIIGTDIFRNYFSKNVWVDCLMERVNSSKSELVLIDDLRFDSEAEALMKHGAMVIQLERMWGQGGAHKSENGLNLDLFTGYPHFYSIPDGDILDKNEKAFQAIKEYFKHVVTTKRNISEQIQA